MTADYSGFRDIGVRVYDKKGFFPDAWNTTGESPGTEMTNRKKRKNTKII